MAPFRPPSAVSASVSAVTAAVADAASLTPASVPVRFVRTPWIESPIFTPSTTSGLTTTCSVVAGATAGVSVTTGVRLGPKNWDASQTAAASARAPSSHFNQPLDSSTRGGTDVVVVRVALATSTAWGNSPDELSIRPRSAGMPLSIWSLCVASRRITPGPSSPWVSATVFNPPSAEAPANPSSGPATFSSTPA